MNSLFSIHSVRFFTLILIQVLILNHINFLGYINPYIYILFIALFPVKKNKIVLISLSFLMGNTIDLFLDTGGIHAAACVFTAYIRPIALKFSFGTIYEHQTIKFNTIDFGSKLTYIAFLTVFHHLILFSLEIFSISRIILVLQKTLFSCIFTIILSAIIIILFSRKTK